MGKYQEWAPTERLGRYIECYWLHGPSDAPKTHRVLPDGCADILFSTRNGEPIGLDVVGLMTAVKTFELPAGQAFFGVRFRPGMAAQFIPEVPQLNDKTESLENILTKPARELFQRLSDASAPLQMAEIMDKFLRPIESLDAAGKALQHLAATTASVDSLVHDTGFSTRQLRRICVDRAGVSPKHLVRILRFRKAAERIAAQATGAAQSNWAGLAVACGYFDQAHFIREFQVFAGCTPGRYLQSMTRANK